MPNADVILQSSDLIDFYVHRSVLIASSPFFRDMFSLPQPQNDAVPEALPMVHLSEDAETLNSLISMLYPVAPEIPFRDDILTLLAAATKYDMDAVQSFIRAEVSRKDLLSSLFAGAFRFYAVAYSKRLVPEMATTARDTLGHPLTFEDLGYALRSFEGGALRDLADFRLRSMGNFSSNLKSFSGCLNGPSKIWVGCPAAKGGNNTRVLPPWLERFYSGLILERGFTETVPTSTQLCDRYMKALQSHVKKKDCNFCMKVHILEGEKYCEKLRDISTQAWNVPAPGERPGTPPTLFTVSGRN
jgi:BTB/POZ domain